jgi:hypothetical protein
LTAFHEITRQPRAGIDLSKAVKLIDDKSTLVQPDIHSKGGKSRRKSAFGEEEEGYMFVEDGFRIRFANGEIIDFYADSSKDKEGWMAVLSKTVGKDVNKTSKWCEMVLARERMEAMIPTAKATAPSVATGKKEPIAPPRTSSVVPRSAPTSPVKQASPVKPKRDPPEVPMMRGGRQSPMMRGGLESPMVRSNKESPKRQVHLRTSARREQVRSMLF